MGVMLIKLGLVIPGNGDGFDDDKNKDGFVGCFEGDDTHQMVMVLVVLVMTGMGGGNCSFLPSPCSERSTVDEHPASYVSSKPRGCFLHKHTKPKHVMLSLRPGGVSSTRIPNQTMLCSY